MNARRLANRIMGNFCFTNCLGKRKSPATAPTTATIPAATSMATLPYGEEFKVATQPSGQQDTLPMRSRMNSGEVRPRSYPYHKERRKNVGFSNTAAAVGAADCEIQMQPTCYTPAFIPETRGCDYYSSNGHCNYSGESYSSAGATCGDTGGSSCGDGGGGCGGASSV